MTPAFPFIIPDLPRPADWSAVYERAFETGTYANFGPLTRELEAKVAGKYAADGYAAIACSSATQGLLAALLDRFEPGQQIGFSNFTFAATYQAIRMAGLIPVPIDIDPVTLELSIDSLAQAGDLAGVMPVRPFGFVREQSALLAYCRSRGLPVIYDSAACLGSGALPDFGSANGEIEVFSLHATKTFAIGEGGIILCPVERENSIRSRLNFGLEPDRTYRAGTNGKMDELHGAVALAQFDRIDGLQAARATHAECYDSFFDAVPRTTRPREVAVGSGWTMHPVVFEDRPVEDVAAAARARGIETRRYYWPAVSAAAHDPMPQPVDLSVSQRIAGTVLCFPIYGSNAAYLIDDLFAALRRVFC